MIDNITAHFLNRELIRGQILEDPSYTPSANVQYLDGTIKTRYANIENMSIRDTTTFTELKGSLHTLHNLRTGAGNQNWDDFSLSKIRETINQLEDLLHCNAKEIKLTNYEFAFNIETEINPSFLLENSVIFYKYLLPCQDHKNDKSMKLLKFIYENFIQKLYDKSKQFSLHKNILHMEIVYRTKDIFSRFGVETLADLRNCNCYIAMFNDYLNRFDQDLLIVDSYNGTRKTLINDQTKIIEYTNPGFWINKRNEKCSNYDIRQYKLEFNNLIKKYGLDSQKRCLRGLLIEKFETLLNS